MRGVVFQLFWSDKYKGHQDFDHSDLKQGTLFTLVGHRLSCLPETKVFRINIGKFVAPLKLLRRLKTFLVSCVLEPRINLGCRFLAPI